jgi:transposase
LTWNQAVVLSDTVPGIDRQAAQTVLAKTGLDMRQFPTDKDLAAWAGLAPGNNQSGGKRYSGCSRKANSSLKTCRVRIAWAAVRTKDTFLKARYQRLASRRGKRRAIVAVAHSILVSSWHILSDGTPYVELGGGYYDQRKKEVKVSYLTRRLEKLTGGTVYIELVPVAA